MTTQELIEALRREDPEGTGIVVTCAGPVLFPERNPSWQDGRVHSLLVDEFGRAVGFRVSRDGTDVVVLHTLSLEDLLLENPAAEVQLVGLSERETTEWERWISEKRRQAKKVEP